jgi:predicted RNase H-like HicB family nuclease
MKRYAVIIERGPRNYSAYVPDLPGCVSAAKTLAGIRRNIREAIRFHLDGMREDGEPIPEPTTTCDTVEV